MNTRTSSCDPKTLAHYIQEVEDDGISTSSFSDSTEQKSKGSSFTSLLADGHSWTTDPSCSLNASTDFSPGSQVTSSS